LTNTQGPSDQRSPGDVRTGTTRQGDPKHSVGQQARGVADTVKREAGHAAEQAVERASEAAEQAKQQARDAATEQKNIAAERMGHYAHALHTASDDLRGHGQDFAAQSIEQAAEGLDRFSGTIRERNLDDLLGTVEDLARRQPVAFFGGAVAVGFGLARLMKSSAERRRQTAVGGGHSGGSVSGSPSTVTSMPGTTPSGSAAASSASPSTGPAATTPRTTPTRSTTTGGVGTRGIS
jgi:hypothetical protein